MIKINIRMQGFYLDMEYDPESEIDQEILAEAFLLMHRKKKSGESHGS